MKATDICYYMSITKEENSSLLIAETNNYDIKEEEPSTTGQLSRRLSRVSFSFKFNSHSQNYETYPLSPNNS